MIDIFILGIYFGSSRIIDRFNLLDNEFTEIVNTEVDFTRFQKRMDNLARHIRQADEDVTQIHQSSKKISARFTQIERVELEHID